MNQTYQRKDVLQMDLEALERQIESELYSLQSFENNMTNRSKCSSGGSQYMKQQPLQPQLVQGHNMQTKKYGQQQTTESRQQIAQPLKIQQQQQSSFGDVLNREKSQNNIIKGDPKQQLSYIKTMEPSNKLKEKNKNLFTIEDLKSEEAKKTVKRRSKSPLQSRLQSRRSDKENHNPYSSGFQSGKTTSSVRSNEKSQITSIPINRPTPQQSTQNQQNSSKLQQQKLQQQSQIIRQNIFDLIQNDNFDSAETDNNEHESNHQQYLEENTFSNLQSNDAAASYWGQRLPNQGDRSSNQEERQSNKVDRTRANIDDRDSYKYDNQSRENVQGQQHQYGFQFDDDMNEFLAQKLIASQRNQSGFNTQDSEQVIRVKNNNNQQGGGGVLKRSQSNLNCASNRYSQVRSSKNSAVSGVTTSGQYVDENCTFKPMLSKKSMELAGKMEDPRIRLTQSKVKHEEKINKLRNSLESQYQFKPIINKNTNKHLNSFQQESVFNYSDEDQGSEFDNDQDFSLNKQSHRIRESPMNGGVGSKVPRWQQLYEQHKVCQMEKEIKMIQKEKEQQEDPELTFQPRLLRTKESNYMYSDNEYDISQRCQMWAQKRTEKIKRVAEQYENRDLEGCTFQPNVSTLPGCHGLSTSTNQKNPPINSNYNHDFSQQITEFNKKGIIEYFERVDAAKKKKQEAEELQNKANGQAWQNKITIPQEFSFMKRNNSSQRSTSNLHHSKNDISPLRQSKDRNNTPSSLCNNKIMLFYKTRSLSSNNLCQVIDPDENQVFNDVSSSINNWDKVKENLHKHLHKIKL